MKSKREKRKPLSIKQAKFIAALPKSSSFKEAALKAGYSENVANQGQHAIGKVIRESKTYKEALEKAGFTKDSVSTILLKHVHDEADARVSLKAIELGAKLSGDMVEHVEVKTEEEMDLSKLNDEELKQLEALQEKARKPS